MFAPGGDFIEGRSVLADLILGACSRFVTFTDCSNDRAYLLGAGTSFATPQVSGAAAVLASEGVHNPDRAATCLFRSARRLGSGDRDPVFGHGGLNVLRAVNLARSGGC
jgi:subtilisin family serine protease